MSLVVRAVDVGYRQTKFVTGMAGTSIRCASFPSVAYPSKRDQTKSAALERRQTISVPIGGLFYEVGPDVALAADSFRASQMHDRFTDTPEYLALLRGALRMMNAPEIDLLVVGLPVALLTLRKTSLEKAMTGIHDVGGGRRVVVKKAMVMAQPQGALVYYATATNRLAAMQDLPSLVVDPGGRTFDWLVSRGMRLVQKKSHSLNRGVSDVLRAVASEISMEIGARYMDVDAIDDLCRFIKGPRRANRLRFLANEGLRAEELRQAQSPQTHVSGEAVPGGIGLGAYGPAGDTNLVFASPLEE